VTTVKAGSISHACGILDRRAAQVVKGCSTCLLHTSLMSGKHLVDEKRHG
jgi:hypothetical protein